MCTCLFLSRWCLPETLGSWFLFCRMDVNQIAHMFLKYGGIFHRSCRVHCVTLTTEVTAVYFKNTKKGARLLRTEEPKANSAVTFSSTEYFCIFQLFSSFAWLDHRFTAHP